MGIVTDLSLRWLYRLTDLIQIKCFLVAQLVKDHLQCRRLGRSSAEGIGYPFQYYQACLVAQTLKNPPTMQETWVQSLS